MKKIRVLLIIPNLGRGGAQRVFHQQLENLSAHFDVTGCVFNWDGSFPSDRKSNIFSLDVPAGKNYVEKFYYFLLRIVRLRMLKKVHAIDVSVSHLEGADYVNVLSRFGRAICWIHGSKKFDQNIKGFLGFIRHRILMPGLYQQADFIIAVSKGIGHELNGYLSNSGVPVQTIYNGFDIATIKKQGAEAVHSDIKNLREQGYVIVTHCRLSNQKNLDALLSIFSKLKASAKVKLLVIGDGELRGSLIEFSRHLNLTTWAVWEGEPIATSSDVFFFGQQENPLRFLQHADLYAMTSLWEGFPLALCEAIIVGLPVIAADCYTGPREILVPNLEATQPISEPHPTPIGYLMPTVKVGETKTIDQWASVMTSILQKINRSKGNEIADIRMKEFHVDVSVKRTVAVIRKVCDLGKVV